MPPRHASTHREANRRKASPAKGAASELQVRERRQIMLGFAAAGVLASVGAWTLGRSVQATRRAKTDSERRLSLMEHLLGVDETGCLHVAAAPLVAGLPPERVLEVAFLMPLLSEGPGGDIHPMAAVPSILHLVTKLTDDTRHVPVLWAVAEAHAWSAKPLNSQPPAAHADITLHEVLDACATPRVDPHVAIWAAQAARMLPRVNEQSAAVLQSVASYEAGRRTERAGGVGGLSFEALAMLCVEARLADLTESGNGVHQTTLLDALWRMQDAGIDVRERASRWLTSMHQSLPTKLDTPVGDITATGGDAFALAPDHPLAAYRAALSAVANDENAFRNSLRARVAERGMEAHDFKYWDALESIADRLEGDERTRWLAAGIVGRVVRSSVGWARRSEALELLEG